ESLPDLVRQYWRYGRGKAMVLKRHPRSLKPRHLAAPTLAVAFAAALALAAVGQPTPLFALLGWYGSVSGVFAHRAARGAGVRIGGAVVAAFACMHLSWGSALIVELLTGLSDSARAVPQMAPAADR